MGNPRTHCGRVLVERAYAEKEHMGLTTWKDAPDGKIQEYDVGII